MLAAISNNSSGPMNSSYLKGLLFTALGVVVLSFDALFIRLIQSDSSSILFWRGFFLSIMLYLWLSIRQGSLVKLSTDAMSIRSSALFAISTISFVSAINLTSVANVLVIISAQPLMAAVMAHFFLKEKSPVRTWIAIIVSTCGIAWVMKDSWQTQDFAGDVLAIVAALSLSAKFVNDRSEQSRNMTVTLIPAAILISFFGFSFGQPFSLRGDEWIWMLVLCTLVVPIAFALISLGPMHIPATEVAMLMLLETVFGPVWAFLWLGEMPSEAAIEGGVLILTTLLVHAALQWKATQKHRSVI